MAISIDTLKAYMPEIGLKNFDTSASERDQRLISGIGLPSGDSDYPDMEAGVVISLQENGEFVQIRLVQLIDREQVQNSTYRNELTTYFCKKNYENKIGRWCLDPADGDVYVDWAIPVEDNKELTFQQFKRVFGGLVRCLKEAWGPMRRILETGSEEKLDAEALKKDIIFILLTANLIELMQKVAAISDAKKLIEIKKLAQKKEFEKISTLIS